jgi:CRP-like cAMP-binding protein
MNPVVAHFLNYLPLSAQEITDLEARLHMRTFKRRQFLLQEGDVCKHYNFVIEGGFRMYKVDAKGNEHNLQFAVENNWISDIGSFHSELPSEMNIEAFENSRVFQIEKSDLLHLYTEYISFNRNFRVLVENAFIELQKRVLQNISSTAEERYLDFLNAHPDLFNRISNVQIASYLGVTPEFLSKIRKNISTK